MKKDVRVTNDKFFKNAISKELVMKISSDKDEPKWMLDLRLKALELFNRTSLPDWGPNLDNLDLNKINYYTPVNFNETSSWEKVPLDIKNTFDNLGILKAEKTYFGGVGAQYDSSAIYHNLKEEFKKKGVIFENMDVAVHKYPELVKKYFMTKCVPISDHKFSMLHAAVWSGGSFIYVPKGVKIDFPLQSYFRMNALSSGQFEHTLIIADENSEIHYIEGCSNPQQNKSSLHAGCVELFVMKGAKIKYSSIENWSLDVYNLNTKRAIVEENAVIEWNSSNLGSQVTMLYPCSVLIGNNSRSESFGLSFAKFGQEQDIGNKVIHIGKNTSSIIRSKSIVQDGGVVTYRGLVKVAKDSKGVISSAQCDTLMLDDFSKSNSYPKLDVSCDDSTVVHEANIGKISDSEIYYLMSRGFSEEEATQIIINGFVSMVVKKFPFEYAVELNKLIDTHMKNKLC